MKIFKAIITLLSVTVIILFLYFENCLSWSFGGIALLIFLLSSSIHLLAHECGHLIGGKMSGYNLLCLQLGVLNIFKKDNKLRHFWKASLRGQCIMIPKNADKLRFVAYNLGGVFANAVIVALSFVLLLFDSFWTSLLFIELLCVGIQKILINAIPRKSNSIPNDGYIVKILKNNTAVQKDYTMYLLLYKQLFLDETISPQEFLYEREAAANEDELLYYNEIQDILNSLNSENN